MLGSQLTRTPAAVACSGPMVASVEDHIDQLMDRLAATEADPKKRAVVLEQYLRLARAHDEETWFEVAAYGQDLAEAYLALGRIEDAVRTICDIDRWVCPDDAEMLCDLAEKLMRSGHQPQAQVLWRHARTVYSDDVWVYVQAGIEYDALGDPHEALTWLTTGMELALETQDPESALEQLTPLRAACLRRLDRQPDTLQQQATPLP